MYLWYSYIRQNFPHIFLNGLHRELHAEANMRVKSSFIQGKYQRNLLKYFCEILCIFHKIYYLFKMTS